MSTERRSWHKRLSLKAELFISFFVGFLLFVVGRLIIASTTYSANIEKTYITQVVSTSEQALSNYATYVSDVVNVSDAIQKRLVNETDETVSIEAADFFDEIKIVSPAIESISLYSGQGRLIAANTNYQDKSKPEEVVSRTWFSSALTSPLVNVFSRVDSASLFTLSKLFNYSDGEKEAVIKIVYDFSGIASRIDGARLGSGGHVYIFDNDSNLVYASGEIGEKEKQAIKDKVIGNRILHEDGRSFLLYLSTIPKTRWRVAIVTNIDALFVAKNKFVINCLCFSLTALAAFLILFYLIATQISHPLVRLQKQREKVENLDFKLQPDSAKGGTKEIVSLTGSFDKRMDKIHHLAQEVVDEQKERTKSELKALQNQINPHFLYNTLDSIIYRIDQNENKKAQERIVALSRFFRISISRGKNIIPVQSELRHVKYYLQIQKRRFGESFGYEIEAEKNTLDLPIIKLILQPIVENSIVHGFGENARQGARILIRIFLHGEFLCFSVEDNGRGRLREQKQEILQSFKDRNIHKGVGLSNVYQRIRIFYGEKSDVRIESEPDKGTKIEILIPLSEVKDNEE